MSGTRKRQQYEVIINSERVVHDLAPGDRVKTATDDEIIGTVIDVQFNGLFIIVDWVLPEGKWRGRKWLATSLIRIGGDER